MITFIRVTLDGQWTDKVLATMDPSTQRPITGRLVSFISKEQVSAEPSREYHGRVIGVQQYTANGGMLLVVVKLFEQTDFIRLMETL